MSLKFMNAVWDLPVLNTHEKMVLLAISDCSNDDGFAFPGYQKLMDKSGMSRSCLAKQIKILTDLEILKVEGNGAFGKGKSVNCYTISTRILLPKSCTLVLFENINDIRKKYSRTISCTLVKPKVASSSTISTRRQHESLVEPSVKQSSVKIRASKNIKFKAPTKEEISLYENENNLNLTGFFDYYESNGWMVGKNKMKKWKAAASGWSSRQITFNNKSKNTSTLEAINSDEGWFEPRQQIRNIN